MEIGHGHGIGHGHQHESDHDHDLTDRDICNATPLNEQRREPVHIHNDEISQLQHFAVPVAYEQYLDHILITRGSLNDRIEKLAADILVDYKDITIHLLCVLKGGSAFFKVLTDSIRALHDCKFPSLIS
jgi:hypothetical protein